MQVEAAKDAVTDAAAKAKEKGAEIADAAKDKAGDLAAKGQAAIADAKDHSGEALEEAKDAAADAKDAGWRTRRSDAKDEVKDEFDGQVTAVDASPDSDAITSDAVEGGTINGASTTHLAAGLGEGPPRRGGRQRELIADGRRGRPAAHREGPGCRWHPGPSLRELARTDRGTVRASTSRRAGRGSCGPNPSLPTSLETTTGGCARGSVKIASHRADLRRPFFAKRPRAVDPALCAGARRPSCKPCFHRA